MKLFNKTFLTLLVAGVLVISSCADLSVENLNQPDRERALANDEDLVSLLEGSMSNVFFYATVYYGVNINAYADMMSTTNMVNSWWVFTDQPRREMPNVPTFPDLFVNSGFWNQFNSGVQSANTLLGIIADGGTIEVDGNDITQEIKANALFLRGYSKTWIGMMYDQGYNIFEDTDLSALEIVPYGDILDAGLADIEEAISIASGVSGFTFNIPPTSEVYNFAQFETIANGLMARALASKARTNEEAASIDWAKVLQYAQKAPGGDNASANMNSFVVATVGSYVYYHNQIDWHAYRVGTPGYLPPDIMIMHTLDPNYPTDYPIAAGEFLEEDDWNPTDPRGAYYGYTPERFAQSADRNKALFTQYYFLREWAAGNNWGADGLPYVFYTNAEMDYLKVEAHLRLGNKASAAAVLNASPFGSGITDFSPKLSMVQNDVYEENGISGGNTILPTASDAEFQYALLREYAVEVSLLTQVGTQWFFMRRWDMLQTGTPTHYAIPANELEITGQDFYTFGGVANAGQPGTASGANSWKNLASKINSSKAFFNRKAKFSASDVEFDMSNVNTTRIGKDHVVKEN